MAKAGATVSKILARERKISPSGDGPVVQRVGMLLARRRFLQLPREACLMLRRFGLSGPRGFARRGRDCLALAGARDQGSRDFVPRFPVGSARRKFEHFARV